MTWKENKDDLKWAALIVVLTAIAYLTYVGNYYSGANNVILKGWASQIEAIHRCACKGE